MTSPEETEQNAGTALIILIKTKEMTTKSINLNNRDEMMDIEKVGVAQEEDQHQPKRFSPAFLDPVSLFISIHFIMLNAIHNVVNEHIRVYIEHVFQHMLSHDTLFHNEIDQLKKFANMFAVNFYIYHIQLNKREFRHIFTRMAQENGESSRAFLVVDELNRNCYPLYMYNNQHKIIQTIFPANDTHTLHLFEDSVRHKWPDHFQTIQQSTNQNIEQINQQNAMEIIETNSIIQTTSLNNSEQDLVSDNPILTESSLSLNSQSTISINIDPLPITTNNIIETIKLSKPVLLNQPIRLRRRRTLEELRDNICPAVQVEGAKQNIPVQIILPSEINRHNQVFYLGAHTTTYDKREHEERLLVPINTLVKKHENLKTNNLSHLIFDVVGDEFDLTTKGVFSKINSDELKNLRKKWSSKMVNLYQDHIITKELIKEKKLKWCRLMFAIYIKLSNGHFERVSPPIYSDLMEGTNGTQSMSIHDIFPDRFCKQGGQMMYIPLTESIEKHNLDVCCNGKELTENQFQIAGKILSLETPVCPEGQHDLHVTIRNTKTNRSITFQRPYHTHDNHIDPCGTIGED